MQAGWLAGVRREVIWEWYRDKSQTVLEKESAVSGQQASPKTSTAKTADATDLPMLVSRRHGWRHYTLQHYNDGTLCRSKPREQRNTMSLLERLFGKQGEASGWEVWLPLFPVGIVKRLRRQPTQQTRRDCDPRRLG